MCPLPDGLGQSRDARCLWLNALWTRYVNGSAFRIILNFDSFLIFRHMPAFTICLSAWLWSHRTFSLHSLWSHFNSQVEQLYKQVRQSSDTQPRLNYKKHIPFDYLISLILTFIHFLKCKKHIPFLQRKFIDFFTWKMSVSILCKCLCVNGQWQTHIFISTFKSTNSISTSTDKNIIRYLKVSLYQEGHIFFSAKKLYLKNDFYNILTRWVKNYL